MAVGEWGTLIFGDLLVMTPVNNTQIEVVVSDAALKHTHRLLDCDIATHMALLQHYWWPDLTLLDAPMLIHTSISAVSQGTELKLAHIVASIVAKMCVEASFLGLEC